MRKLYFTYNQDSREGLEATLPEQLSRFEAESIDEVQAENVLERVPDLVEFVEQCYRILKFDSKATFSAPQYNTSRAWASPFAVRGISEETLNFASKNWREVNKCLPGLVCDFEVTGQIAVEPGFMNRAEVARAFMTKHYGNVVIAILFTLTKKPLNATGVVDGAK